MAKVFDLTSILEEKKSAIKVGDEEFEICDGFKDMLEIDALANRRNEMGDVEFVKEFLRISLGKKVANMLIERNYRFAFYVKLMDCIEETLTGDNEDGPK